MQQLLRIKQKQILSKYEHVPTWCRLCIVSKQQISKVCCGKLCCTP